MIIAIGLPASMTSTACSPRSSGSKASSSDESTPIWLSGASIAEDTAVVTTAVSSAMDAPLSQIGVDSSLDDAFEPLLRGEQAVLVIEAGNPIAMITRADLLEFVAHRGQG